MTVDWSRWMQERDALLQQYRAIVTAEILAARANSWRRLDMALRYPYTWRDKIAAPEPHR